MKYYAYKWELRDELIKVDPAFVQRFSLKLVIRNLPYLNIKLDNTAKLSSEHPQLTNALAYLDGGKQYWDLDE